MRGGTPLCEASLWFPPSYLDKTKMFPKIASFALLVFFRKSLKYEQKHYDVNVDEDEDEKILLSYLVDGSTVRPMRENP